MTSISHNLEAIFNKRFADDDLVYGPSSGGALRAWQQERGGRMLTDLPRPMELSWEAFTLRTMEQALQRGAAIHFDLTNVQQIAAVLACQGPHATATTSVELRYLRDHWDRFRDCVRFYRGGRSVEAPWVTGPST